MRLIIITVILIYSSCYSQTILNSESLLGNSNDNLATQIKLSLNWESGNENTFSTFNQILLGIKIEKTMWRLIIGHDYENDEGKIVANDWSGQIRLNHFINSRNSIYGFVQSQNIRVLQMNHRFLAGGGYRHSIFSKKNEYFDLAAGLFYEDEKYPNLRSFKIRLNINSFIRVKLFEKLFFNCVSYFQINTELSNDIRLFVEPEINYEFQKCSLSIIAQNRYNSMPYLLNKKNDFLSQLVLRINIFK